MGLMFMRCFNDATTEIARAVHSMYTAQNIPLQQTYSAQRFFLENATTKCIHTHTHTHETRNTTTKCIQVDAHARLLSIFEYAIYRMHSATLGASYTANLQYPTLCLPISRRLDYELLQNRK